jgi:sugar phosphate isomerase/epimerase
MQLASSPHTHLTYCLNVHPGESLAEMSAAIREHAAVIRAAVAPGVPFGLGLRVADRAAREMEDPTARRALRELLQAQGMYAFTINGFPYGSFHGTTIKEAVYRPDWRDPARTAYTGRLARLLAELLPEGMSGSISTVPGSYKAWIRSAQDVRDMVEQLAAAALELARLYDATGRELHLGLEPEPDCFLETTAETLAFFREQLVPHGARWLAARHGGSPAAAEALLRRHLGVCFDTCHLALQFEDLAESLRRLCTEGIRISKIQLSAALRTCWQPGAVAALQPFAGSIYLHQVKARAQGRVISRGDLAEALAAGAGAAGEEWRVHCHVPLYFAGDGVLATTADQLDAAFFREVRTRQVEHLEIETYTFHVLPEELRRLGVDCSIAEEYRWIMPRLA